MLPQAPPELKSFCAKITHKLCFCMTSHVLFQLALRQEAFWALGTLKCRLCTVRLGHHLAFFDLEMLAFVEGERYFASECFATKLALKLFLLCNRRCLLFTERLRRHLVFHLRMLALVESQWLFASKILVTKLTLKLFLLITLQCLLNTERIGPHLPFLPDMIALMVVLWLFVSKCLATKLAMKLFLLHCCPDERLNSKQLAQVLFWPSHCKDSSWTFPAKEDKSN